MFQPMISRFKQVIKEHRAVLELPGSPTGRLTNLWAKIMVFPQMLIPIFILLGAPILPVLLIFFARIAAMQVVWLLDRYMPYTRALGLCHLVTFGPVFVYLTMDYGSIYAAWGWLGFVFFFYYIVIAACLYMNLRDLALHIKGQPFPCYMRDYYREGYFQEIDDPRIKEPVTMFNRLFW